jgi:hypothetical protein
VPSPWRALVYDARTPLLECRMLGYALALRRHPSALLLGVQLLGLLLFR